MNRHCAQQKIDSRLRGNDSNLKLIGYIPQEYPKESKGFTLIEILVALMIMSIALAALLKTTGSNIHVTQKIKEKTYGHWVAMQAIKMIQLGFIDFAQKPYATEATTIFNEKWYWRAELRPTAIKSIQEIKVKVSKTETGPFQSPLIGFKYNPSS